jgi:hypothetical protein
MRLGAGQTLEYCDQEAEGLTGPLLHAGALSGDLTIVDVYGWVLKREQDTPKKLLRKAGADDAIERLQNVYAYTERQRDGIIGTAAVQLKAYGHPGAARTASRTNALTPPQLFANGEANTLYIVAGALLTAIALRTIAAGGHRPAPSARVAAPVARAGRSSSTPSTLEADRPGGSGRDGLYGGVGPMGAPAVLAIWRGLRPRRSADSRAASSSARHAGRARRYKANGSASCFVVRSYPDPRGYPSA